MSEKLESVSNLIDDSVRNPSDVVDFLLEDTEAQKLWETGHDLKHLLHEPRGVLASSGFAQRISEKIQEEPSLLVHSTVDIKQSRQPVWLNKILKPVAGFAVAATVAAVAVFGVGGQQSVGAPSGLSIADAQPPTIVSNPAIVPVTFTGDYDHRTYWQGSDQATSQELNRYLATHLEHSNPGGFQSVMPYVRVVGYDDE